MLLTLAFAFAAQDIQLNAPATEAVKCAQANIATLDGAPNQGRVIAQTFYFLMRAADADPGTEGALFVDRTTEMAHAMSARGKLDDAGVLARCDKAYPLARSTATAKLPAAGFDRDIMCVSVTSYLGGMLKGANIEMADLDFTHASEGYGNRLSDSVLDAHNIRSDADTDAALGNGLRASLKFGNLETVFRACSAAL